MKLQANNHIVNFFNKNMHYRVILACLLALVLFSAAAGNRPTPAQAYANPGPIAYVRSNDATGDEIRLIEPNGSNDRLLWRTNVSDLPELDQIYSLAWQPDARELAFASRHEEPCSFYNSDIYTIRSDGSGYRRVTAPPACGKAGGLPTGTVNVYISNVTVYSGPFYVYFQGAPGPQTITLAPYDSAVVTFTDVADFGSIDQWAVVIYAQERFVSVNGNADVIPGETVDTDGYLTMWSSDDHWGWINPSWRSDGSEISAIFDRSVPYSIPAGSTAPGGVGSELFNIAPGDFPSYPDAFTWAPSGPRENQLMYTGWFMDADANFDEFVFLINAGSTSHGDALFRIGEQGSGNILLGLAWLPDSSGIIYSRTEGFNENANIYEYSFATGTSTRITNYSSGFPRNLSISPDGAHVIYEYQANGNWMDLTYDLDLWMMDRNGDGQTLFVQDARAPAWSPQALPQPVEDPSFRLMLPMLLR